MNGRKIIVFVLVVGLAGGLHFGFRGLSTELPQLFPRLALEKRVAPPMTADDEMTAGLPAFEEDPLPPQGATPMKKAGEDLLASVNDSSPSKGKNEGTRRIGRRLVTATPIPELSGPARQISETFEITADLSPIVNFWKKVYAVYDSNHVALHDTENLDIEYGVLDFSDLDRRGLSNSEKKSARESEIAQQIRRIKEILTELDEWQGVTPLSGDAKRIAALFSHIAGADKYKKAKERIRAQTGLKERFAAGIKRSGRYMPFFEEIFQSYGVPKEISRLAFVESLFRERARSTVGAAGLWQFMPETAKRYMTVDPLVDERYDPIMATHSAARLLLKNRGLLGTWPLAINAYNSGPGNLLKAISHLGTRNIGTIVTRYKTGSYAFASRNFYPSFLAALDVYENREKFFGPISKDPVMRFDRIEIPTTMSFREVAFLANATIDEIKELNPAYAPEVFDGEYSMPPGTQVRVPEGGHETFASRFVQFPTGIGGPTTMIPTASSLVRNEDTRD